MKEEYANAYHTVIFLGEPTEETEMVLRSLCSAPPSNSGDLPYGSLLDRPWFKRVWIYQELMASQNLGFKMADNRIRGGRFHESTKALHKGRTGSDLWQTSFHMADERLRIKSPPFNTKFASDFRTRLPSTLAARRGLGALDPRDMLFAHRSILKASHRTEEMKKLVEVDYGKPCGEVYADLARHLCSQ